MGMGKKLLLALTTLAASTAVLDVVWMFAHRLNDVVWM